MGYRHVLGFLFQTYDIFETKKAVLAGVEPATFRLTAECSNQLS